MTELEKFAAWKGYPLPALNSDNQFPNDSLHREWVAFRAGLSRSLSSVGAVGALSDKQIIDICAKEFKDMYHETCDDWIVGFARRILNAAAPVQSEQEPLVKASAVPGNWQASTKEEAMAMFEKIATASQEEESPAYVPQYSNVTDHNGKLIGVKWDNAKDALPVAGTTSHIQPSIDTRELSTLMTVWLRADEGDEAKEAYDAVVAHINAKLTQARNGAISMEVARDEAVLAEYAAIARAEAAESKLAAFRAGVEGLAAYSREMRGGQHGRIGFEDFYAVDDVQALFDPLSAQASETGAKASYQQMTEKEKAEHDELVDKLDSMRIAKLDRDRRRNVVTIDFAERRITERRNSER